MSRFDELGGILGVTFKNESLIREALTHRSYLNENPNWETSHKSPEKKFNRLTLSRLCLRLSLATLRLFSSLPLRMTLAPSCKKLLAIALPIPFAAPVMAWAAVRL